jgi:FemAB-related protein (PEP-CTERM system-associated)
MEACVPQLGRAGGDPSETTGTAPTKVVRAGAQDAERWNAFLESCPAANFYQRFEWLAVNERMGHQTLALLAERGGKVVGIFPLVYIRSRLFGNMLSSMPFVNFGGPAGRDEAALMALVEAACRHADDAGVDYLEIRATHPVAGLPAKTDKVSMTIQLCPDPDALFDGFSRSHRHNIRRAAKNDIEVRSGAIELLDVFYKLMSLSWRELGTPLYAKDYFVSLLDRMGQDVRIFVAYRDNLPIATAMNGHFAGTVEGLWAGMDPAHRQLQPNYVLYWAMIKDACERGMNRFHLGRSTVGSGAVEFKSRWSAEPTQLYWNYHLVRASEMPALNPDNPRYALAIRAWRRLPLALTRVVGPRLARLIP